MTDISLDTHFYDAKWKQSLEEADKKYEEFIQSHKLREEFSFDKLCDVSRHDTNIKQQAHNWRTTIISSDCTDPINNVSPKSILQKIEQMLSYFDEAPDSSIIDLYIEQLADISNGACIQGQTTRLFQVYLVIVS